MLLNIFKLNNLVNVRSRMKFSSLVHMKEWFQFTVPELLVLLDQAWSLIIHIFHKCVNNSKLHALIIILWQNLNECFCHLFTFWASHSAMLCQYKWSDYVSSHHSSTQKGHCNVVICCMLIKVVLLCCDINWNDWILPKGRFSVEWMILTVLLFQLFTSMPSDSFISTEISKSIYLFLSVFHFDINKILRFFKIYNDSVLTIIVGAVMNL